jgi:hypothetical protein
MLTAKRNIHSGPMAIDGPGREGHNTVIDELRLAYFIIAREAVSSNHT